MSIRLPDFTNSKTWKEIRDRVNATDDIEFDLVDVDGITMNEIESLKSGSISIENIHEHIDPIDQTFVFKGQKVILYIKQQKYNSAYFTKPSYKYHLCYCKTLHEMEAKGRFKTRYVVTQKTDGKFLIDVIDIFSGRYLHEDKLYEMDVCKNCLNALSNKYPKETLFGYYSFELSEFIKKYNTTHLKRPLYTPTTIPRNEYSEDWKFLSKNLREEAEYICSKCNRNFVNNKELLHVHHRDGLKWNNRIDNLAVLCIHCHAEEPGHNKLKFSRHYA